MRWTWKVSGIPAAAWMLVAVTLPLLAGQEIQRPSLTDQEKEEFLRTAKVIRSREVGIGINNTSRVTLTDGRITHDAHLTTVDIYKHEHRTARGTELNFRDSYRYNIAAYKLDRLLGLNMVPVSVERKVGGDTGAVTWWVDDVMMMESKRYVKKIPVPPAKRIRWNDQMYQVRIFNELVYNNDPNMTNVLITNDWGLRLIDYSRAFRVRTDLRNPKNLSRCDRRIYDALRALDEETLTRRLGDCLRKSEIRAILARRDEIVRFFDNEIATKGESAVICDRPGH